MDSPNLEFLARYSHLMHFIHDNLDVEIFQDALTEVSGFSPYHFHRLFKGLTGSSYDQYILRARLEQAAYLLVTNFAYPVENMGIDFCFSSQAEFERAFEAHFHVSPDAYRWQSHDPVDTDEEYGEPQPTGTGPLSSGPLLSGPLSSGPLNSGTQTSRLPCDIEVKTLPGLRVACVRAAFGPGCGPFSAAVDRAFERVRGWAAARGLLQPGALLVGIPYDDPRAIPPEYYRYDACVTVPAGFNADPGDVELIDIGGGLFAVGHIPAGAQAADPTDAAIDAIYGTWLPSSGYLPADRPALEIYPDLTGSRAALDFCIPLEAVPLA